ncbi:hypothetical protein PQO03_05335 [Lentisphaera profundi]|uniref:MotA/TolQ/ExbB proton channel domain-containing protein n=1 Tax=Lentisphaera profundi TaxID=1658616 RepID=A0ABY7VXC1_9BACT|nr:hypothetical protein [Lentisphaera profundi]WDE97374.1 hypothetical protein PQO03_05335 [Lentisphaera profundi]
MGKTTLIFSLIYIIMGIGGYFASGKASVTALIPSFFGIVFFIFAVIAIKKPSLNKHMLHGIMFLVLVSLGGTFKGFGKMINWLSGQEIERLLAVQIQGTFFILNTVLLIFGINSFIQARKIRKQE